MPFSHSCIGLGWFQNQGQLVRRVHTVLRVLNLQSICICFCDRYLVLISYTWFKSGFSHIIDFHTSQNSISNVETNFSREHFLINTLYNPGNDCSLNDSNAHFFLFSHPGCKPSSHIINLKKLIHFYNNNYPARPLFTSLTSSPRCI